MTLYVGNCDPDFILLFDTTKVFDTIDHDYLFPLMDKIHMSEWIINIITVLFHDVNVFPILDGPPIVSI